MKKSRFLQEGRGAFSVFWFGLALWFTLGLGVGTRAATSSLTNASSAERASNPMDISRLRFSPGIADIVKLVKADIDPEVIKAFIDHSPISYNPTAQELIALKRFAVPNDVVRALLVHQAHSTQAAPPAQFTPRKSAPLATQDPENSLSWGVGSFGSPYGYPQLPPPSFPYPTWGPTISFNNSYPTFVNGHPIYSGYYVPGYGIIW